MRSRARLRRPIFFFLSLSFGLAMGAALAGSASSGVGSAATAPQRSTQVPFGAVGALVSARPTSANDVIPTVLRFNGNPPDESCTGNGTNDVVLVGCAALEVPGSAPLSPGPAAKWVANATFDGTGARNIYDPNWQWTLSGPTTIQGNMKIEVWQSVNAAALAFGMDWTIRIWADGVAPPAFEETGIINTPSMANVPELLTFNVILPQISATSNFILHIDPTFLDTGAAATAYYDSSLACPGAAAGPCDSKVTMPVPTAARILSFDARSERGRVVVRWRTAAENGILGFNVWRLSAGGKTKINRELIRARGAAGGARYSFVDRATRRGSSPTYRLQIVNRNGTPSWYGSAGVRIAR